MNTKTKKIAGIFVVVALTISSVGYYFQNNSLRPSKDIKQTSENTKNKDEINVTKDIKKTEELKKEKGVLNGQVYVQNNVATATMILKDNIKEEEAKALADKYAKELKKTYNNMKINVQAVQNGKSIANITIDK